MLSSMTIIIMCGLCKYSHSYAIVQAGMSKRIVIADVQEATGEPVKITLTFRKFIFDPHKRMLQ